MAANVEMDGDGSSVRPGVLGRLGEWLDWKFNPVLLRDLRLYARGRMMLVAFMLVVVALVMMAILYLYIARYENNDGTALLGILTTLLSVVCGAVVPNLVFERFRTELANRATELALMSPLTPGRLVRGKLLGAWCVSLLIVSMAMPIFATAYLLGGVNFLSIAGLVAGVVLAGMVMPTAQLFMATERLRKSMSRLSAVGVFLFQLILMFSYASFLGELFISGHSYRADFYRAAAFSIAVAGILIGQFLYFATVSRLQSEAAGRDAAPRISLMAAAYLGGILAVVVMYLLERYGSGGPGSNPEEMLGIAACVVAPAFCIGFLIVCHSSPVPSRGLVERWRSRPLRRLLLLPGLPSLVAYFLLNAVIIVGCALVAVTRGPDSNDLWRGVCFVVAPFMIVAYGMLAYYYVVLRLVKNKRSPSLLPTTITVTNVALAIVSIFILVLTAYSVGRHGAYRLFLATNPVGVYVAGGETRNIASDVGAYGLGVLALLALLLLPALFADMRTILGLPGSDTDAPN